MAFCKWEVNASTRLHVNSGKVSFVEIQPILNPVIISLKLSLSALLLLTLKNVSELEEHSESSDLV